MSAFDPKRTFGRTWCPFQSVSLSQQDTLLVGSKVAMKRREFITFVGVAAVLPLAASAQSKIPRIGFIGNSTAALEANLVDAFREGLRELGYEEGRNIVIEYRWAGGEYQRFSTLVAELIAAKVDLIVTAGTPAALAVKKATTTVPLVMVAVGDPVGTGLVPSLARPGGNLTGLSSIAPDLEGKRLQLLREIVPALSYVAMFVNSVNPFHVSSMRQARAAAESARLDCDVCRQDWHQSIPIRIADYDHGGIDADVTDDLPLFGHDATPPSSRSSAARETTQRLPLPSP